LAWRAFEKARALLSVNILNAPHHLTYLPGQLVSLPLCACRNPFSTRLAIDRPAAWLILLKLREKIKTSLFFSAILF
jgi:hypothetical protein